MKTIIDIFREDLKEAVNNDAKPRLIKNLTVKLEKAYKYGKYTEDFTCKYCETNLFSNYEEWSLDHFYPKSKGGISSIENLLFTCKRCNNIKKDMTPEDFINMLTLRLSTNASFFYFDNTEIPRRVYETILKNVNKIKENQDIFRIK